MNASCTFSLVDIAELVSAIVLFLATVAMAIAFAVARRKSTRTDRAPRKRPERKNEVRLIVPR